MFGVKNLYQRKRGKRFSQQRREVRSVSLILQHLYTLYTRGRVVLPLTPSPRPVFWWMRAIHHLVS